MSRQRLLYVRSTVWLRKRVDFHLNRLCCEYLNQSSDLTERHSRKCMENRIKQFEFWSLGVPKGWHAFAEINPQTWLVWNSCPDVACPEKLRPSWSSLLLSGPSCPSSLDGWLLKNIETIPSPLPRWTDLWKFLHYEQTHVSTPVHRAQVPKIPPVSVSC